MLDARRLQIFCAVAETGSFTAAGHCLHLTQSAISQQVAMLEREVGFALVERLPRGVELTRTGRLLAERGKILLRNLASLEHDLRREAAPRTNINLGVFSTAGAYLAPLVIQRYRQRVPNGELILHACQPDELQAKLAEGVIDVGLTWDYDFIGRSIGALHRQHLLEDPLCLLLPRSHGLATQTEAVSLTDVAHESWVVRGHRPPYHEAFETMCRIAGFEPDVVFRTEDYQSLQGFVAAGVGLAVAPRLSVSALRPDIVIRPLEKPAFIRRIDAVALPNSDRDWPGWRLLSLLKETWFEGSENSLPSHDCD